MDPLKLFERDQNRIEPFLTKWWIPISSGSIAFMATCFINYGTRRPVFSGIQRHVLASTAAFFAGKYLDEQRDDYLAERDAVFRHYIELHPEDFPVMERTKFKDVLQKWIPIR